MVEVAFAVYVPSLLSMAYPPPGVVVWEEIYRTRGATPDDRLAAEIVVEWHENVGVPARISTLHRAS